jgi:hypothetical protein
MLVKFVLKESNGNIMTENKWEFELDNSEILVLLQANEVFYPRGDNGWGTHCTIIHTIYEMYQEPRFLEVHLKENE